MSAPGPTTRGLEFRPGWLLLTVSVVAVVVLRHHRVALVTYAALVVIALAAAAILLPRWLDRLERRFQREALAHLSRGDRPALEALAARQGWLRRLGRGALVTERRALAAARLGTPAEAVTLYAQAVAEAPAAARDRLELALAEAELTAGQEAAGEGRLRALVARAPADGRVRASLGRALLRRGEAEEAAVHLAQALAQADPRERAELEAALAQAQRPLV